MISACAFNQDTRFSFSFSKVEQSVRKAWFSFLFIFFHRTTFGVAKASVCFREAATKKVLLNKTNTQQKGKSIQLQSYSNSKKIVHKNQTVKMAINNVVGLRKFT